MQQVLTQPRWIGSDLNDTERSQRGGREENRTFKEAAAQAYAECELVQIATGSGKVSSLTVNGGNQVTSGIAGQALKAATGVTDSDVTFHQVRADDLFEINVYHATPASAVSAQTMLGKVFGLIKVNGRYHVDLANAVEGAGDSLGTVQVVGFVDAVGDTYGRVICKFVPLSIASNGASVRRVLQL